MYKNPFTEPEFKIQYELPDTLYAYEENKIPLSELVLISTCFSGTDNRGIMIKL
jgi:hypothetical protein